MRIQDPKKIWSRNRSLLNLLCKFAILLTFWGLERGYPMTCLKQPSVQLTWTLLVFSNGPQLHFQRPLPLPPASRARSMLYSSFCLVLFETMGCVCVSVLFLIPHIEKDLIAPANHEDSGSKKDLIEKSCPIKPEGLGAPFCSSRMASPRCPSYKLAEPNVHRGRFLSQNGSPSWPLVTKWYPDFARLASARIRWPFLNRKNCMPCLPGNIDTAPCHCFFIYPLGGLGWKGQVKPHQQELK